MLAKRTNKPPLFPHRFVYASAACKGLQQTLEAWAKLPLPKDAELVVTNPGYDTYEAERIIRELQPKQVKYLGVMPSMDDVADILAESAGLFYVNTHAECTSITLAMCEALGRRVHMLCLQGLGGVKETVSSPLVTEDPKEFSRDFLLSLHEKEEKEWQHGEPLDFSATSAAKAWLDLLTFKSPKRRVAAAPFVVPVDPYDTFVREAVAKITACPSVVFPLSSVLELLEHHSTRSGLWLEFGVFEGRSLSMLAAARGAARVYGFDSFKGLPEDWKPGLPKGAFACNPPTVDGAELVVGMFEDTLPGFRFDDEVTLVHVDCDIGSAAQTALGAVRKHLADVSYIVFDELWNYDGFEKHEIRALWDQLVTHGYRVDFLWRSSWEQVACRVTRSAATLPG